MKTTIEKIDKPCIIAIFISVIIYLPFILIGGNIHLLIHDQFDGDLLTYIMQARDLLLPNIPEFMDGTKTALTMPAPGFVVLFYFFDALTAIKMMQMTEVVIGAIGMYLLTKRIGAAPWIRIAISVMFTSLPFYTVYGLSVMGIPLLVNAIVDIIRNTHIRTAFIVCVLYAAFSSLVLVGFAVIIFIIMAALYYLARKNIKVVKRLMMAAFCLGAVYALMNYKLVFGIMCPGEPLHRGEFVNSSTSFINGFWEMLKNGSYHEGSVHSYISALALPMVLYALVSIPVLKALHKKTNKELKIALLLTYAVALGIALLYGFWRCTPVVQWRNFVGGIVQQFQFDRFYFLNPLVWYFLLSCILVIIEKDCVCYGRIAAKVGIVIQLAIVIFCGKHIWDSNRQLQSDWNSVAQRFSVAVCESDASSVTWDMFWDSDNFERVNAYIENKYGQAKAEYKVISVGMFPSVALFNGYYCADGYSNNYTLKYKHAFGEMIADELEKSESLAQYFYNWGNRCYVFSSELDGFYYDKNSGAQIENLALNTEVVKALDISYIISAVPIYNFQKAGFEFEEDFVSDSSNYHLYLYRLL